MKMQITEKEYNTWHGYTGQSIKLTMVGYLKCGAKVRMEIEDDGWAEKSICHKMDDFGELDITISGTITKEIKLV